MSILVTGANGLVGSRVVARLSGSVERVIAAGRGPHRFATEVEYLDIDLRERGRLARAIDQRRPAGVIHCAALTGVDECEEDPVAAWTLNVALVEECALACRRAGARLTALSSDYVFDGEKGDYSEDDMPNPRGVYARTKRAGEEATLLLAGDRAVCRVALVYSGWAGSRPTFASTAAENLLAGKPVKAFVDQAGSPTLADNAAEMIIGVHRSGTQGVFHCCGATAVTRLEFARALAGKLAADPDLVVPIRLAELKLRAPRPMRSTLRVEKVKSLLGDAVPLPLDAALDRFLVERR